MIHSMTGFGKAVAELPNLKITVEIKSLNSKQVDLSMRMPSSYRQAEIEIRNTISQSLERGKIDVLIYTEGTNKDNSPQINIPLVKEYKEQILELSRELGIEPPADWYSTLLRLPEVLKSEKQEVSDDEIELLKQVINEAIDRLQVFRKQEGVMLQQVFEDKINNIALLLEETTQWETERLDRIKSKIIEALDKIDGYDYDKNRLEQEMIFYIEKLDVNEEKNRLAHHLNYFKETLQQGHGQGKKLGFIAQEIGREINTLGSKANHTQLQKLVVKMKDELEQIKEQILNVL